jgi:hypothetical protein
MKNPLIICDFMKAEPLDPSANDPKLYEELESFESLQEKLNDLLD